METVKIRLAKEEDAVYVHQLMEQVHEAMENPELFVCDDLEFVQRHVSEQGIILMAEDENDLLLGSLIVRFPKDAEDNLGLDNDLDRAQLMQVAHMESGVVAVQARGRGILHSLMEKAEPIVKNLGYKFLMGTVADNNPASYRNFEKLQYQHIATKEKYGGKIRRIYYKSI